MPSTPRSPIFRHRSMGNAFVRSISAARGAISAFAKLRTVSRRRPIVSPRAKSSVGMFIVRFRLRWPLLLAIGCGGALGVNSRSLIRAAVKDDQRLLHQCAEHAPPVAQRMHFAGHDAERAARLHDAALGNERRAVRRGEKIELVFDGE